VSGPLRSLGSVAILLLQSFSAGAAVTVAEAAALKSRHFDRLVILLCVCWYLAYNLSLGDPEEMIAERGIKVDNAF
jgi:hypothetical protein